jgi:hypothetical protein
LSKFDDAISYFIVEKVVLHVVVSYQDQ